MPDHLHALPAGHRLGEYRVDHVLGSGGFGITYYTRDIHLDKPVAIKEYLPNEFALRIGAITVKPKSSADQDDYQWGLERFLDEARALARFDHPHLNKVHRFFEDNGTAYIVLEYIEGETLSQLLKREGGLDQARLRRLLDELLSGLEEVHAAGYVHRDLKPGNIMLREDGSAVLLDFGAARQAVGQRSKSITSILTPGYAPIEQYDQKAEDVGPWSDLYALGMVAYRCVSGIGDSEMPDAVARARLERKGEGDKDMVAAIDIGKGRYDESLLRAVDWSIEVYEERRPRSVAALREILGGGALPATTSTTPLPVQPAATAAAVTTAQSSPANEGKAGMRHLVILILLFASVAAATAVGVLGTPLWREYKAEETRLEANKRFATVFGRDASPDAINADGITDLHYAAAANLPELIKFLLDAGAEIDARMYEDEEFLSEISLKILRELTKTNKFDNSGRYGETPLHYAALGNARSAAKLLIARGVDVHVKYNYGHTPLHAAAQGNAREVAELLIARGADVNAKSKYGNTPLHDAAWRNAHEVAELLIARGADANAKDNGGDTPLHDAAVNNAVEAAELLIAGGADVNTKDDDGQTPLHPAAFNSAREVAELLIAGGADFNAKDNYGDTPLHDAAFLYAHEVVELLIAGGADVNAKNNVGRAPLHYAALNSGREVAELLIAGGAKVNARDNDGETPRDIAEREGYSELARLLR